MFTSLVSKFKEIAQPSSSQQPVEYPEGNDNELVEDGFLVLGQTRSDREAVNGGTFDPSSVDAPPTYNQVMTPPVLSNQPPVFPPSSQTTVPPGGVCRPITAISDVPFKLAPSLAIVKDTRENPAFSFICDTQPRNFNWNKYHYDFSAEESVLREFCVNVKHTSASIVLNECWDSDVRVDMEMMLNKLVPQGLPYKHSCEGPDDMPAHVKAALLGSCVSIPITDGLLNMGTWQGIWLCEHRDTASSRSLVCTIQGAAKK